MSEAKHTPGPLFVLTPDPQYPLTFWIENETNDLDSQENYVSFSGYFGSYGPELFAAAPELLEALKAILNEETISVMVGYDNGSGGGNYVYADAIRTDAEAFIAARALIAKAEGRSDPTSDGSASV